MSYSVSLCIPTNGVIEWVVPVVESIYAQNANPNDFEVVITDNGNNEEFEALMNEYANKYSNFNYRKTQSSGFLNQIDCFKLAKGKMIKFINHRMKLNKGSIDYLIQFSNEYAEQKPVVYFTNGVLKNFDYKEYGNLDGFMHDLAHYSSWSAGITFWKDNLYLLDNIDKYNPLFPHLDLLLINKDNNKFIINNKNLLTDISDTDSTKKGKYNLFFAFAVEYVSIILELYRNHDINYSTFLYIKNDNFKFLVNLHYQFILRKIKCSYELENYKNNISVYYSYSKIYFFSILMFLKIILFKIFKIN